jgi:hypothetical protein
MQVKQLADENADVTTQRSSTEYEDRAIKLLNGDVPPDIETYQEICSLIELVDDPELQDKLEDLRADLQEQIEPEV